jgi:hypothetical protein
MVVLVFMFGGQLPFCIIEVRVTLSCENNVERSLIVALQWQCPLAVERELNTGTESSMRHVSGMARPAAEAV